MEGHSSYINDLVFAPKGGQEIASVSDDHTCRYVLCQLIMNITEYLSQQCKSVSGVGAAHSPSPGTPGSPEKTTGWPPSLPSRLTLVGHSRRWWQQQATQQKRQELRTRKLQQGRPPPNATGGLGATLLQVPQLLAGADQDAQKAVLRSGEAVGESQAERAGAAPGAASEPSTARW